MMAKTKVGKNIIVGQASQCIKIGQVHRDIINLRIDENNIEHIE